MKWNVDLIYFTALPHWKLNIAWAVSVQKFSLRGTLSLTLTVLKCDFFVALFAGLPWSGWRLEHNGWSQWGCISSLQWPHLLPLLLTLGLGGGHLPRPTLHLAVGGGEDDHVGHQDDDAGAEDRHDDGQDDVELTVFLCMEICKVEMRIIQITLLSRYVLHIYLLLVLLSTVCQ